MGKIFNALEKYRKERRTYLVTQKLRKSDWDVLLQYDRETGKLDLRASVIAKNKMAVQRLLANRMILRDGTLTVKGRKICEGMARVMKLPQARQQPDHAKKEIKHRKPDTIPFSKRLNAADWSALMKYDRETGNLLKFDPEIGQLTKDSKAVLRSPDTIQRLIESNMILPGGWLTASAKQECEKRERKLKRPLVNVNDLVAKKTPQNRISESRASDVVAVTKSEKADPQKLQPEPLAVDKERQAVIPRDDTFILGKERREKIADE
ncbi:MAG: hypothetical protein PVF56_25395, partial [Desulfobacterales bacterium]